MGKMNEDLEDWLEINKNRLKSFTLATIVASTIYTVHKCSEKNYVQKETVVFSTLSDSSQHLDRCWEHYNK